MAVRESASNEDKAAASGARRGSDGGAGGAPSAHSAGPTVGGQGGTSLARKFVLRRVKSGTTWRVSTTRTSRR
jgi:hypothetical protein